MSKWVRLGEIASFQTGPFGTQLKASEYVTHGTPIINVKNIGYGNLVLDDIDMVPETVCDRLQVHLLKEGDIVFGRKGSVDRHCYIKKENEGWMQGSDCIRARINEGVNPQFVSYYLMLEQVKKQIISAAVGSTMPSLNTKILENVKICLPPVKIQDSIVSLLSALDDKIENNNRMNTELEAMAKSIYDYWFLQFDFPDKNGKPYKSSGGKMIWNEMLKREIPKGWEVEEIGSMVEASRGISYNSSTLEGKGVPMINLASFNVDGSYKVSGIKTYSGEYTQDKILKPYDLVMCNTQQTAIDFKKDIIGKTFLVPDIFEGDIVSSHHVTTVKVKIKNMKFYLNFLFNTLFFHKYISGFTNGTNILGLLFDGVEKYRIVVPSESVLEKFSTFISNLEKQKSLIMRENQELIALRDFLLPLFINGQVGFKEE